MNMMHTMGRTVLTLLTLLTALTVGAQEPCPDVFEPAGDYRLPEPVRTVIVESALGLAAAIKEQQAGDRWILAPGNYGRVDFGYTKIGKGTTEAPIQIVGQAGVFIQELYLCGARNVIVYDVDFLGDPTSTALGAVLLGWGGYNTDFVKCGFRLDSVKKCGIYRAHATLGNPGDIQIIDCWFENTWTPGKAQGDSMGIGMTNVHCGDGWRIAGCNFHGWYRDAIMFGNSMKNFDEATGTPFVQDVTVERNLIWLCQDDAIECDKSFKNLIVRNNVIGGTTPTLVAGISIAPGGPGPIEIYGNSIAGFHYSEPGKVGSWGFPIKFNTQTSDAYTKNVYVHDNVIVNWHGTSIIVYWAIPVLKVSDIRFERNTIFGRGSMYVAENGWFPPNFTLDHNRLYSTGEFPAYRDGSLFRMHVPSTPAYPLTGGNVYAKTFEQFQSNHAGIAGQNYEAHGTWDARLAGITPVQVHPSVPVEYLCRWAVPPMVDPTPTPEPTPEVTPTPTPTPEPTPEPTPIPTPTPEPGLTEAQKLEAMGALLRQLADLVESFRP
jgi:hypothetical protein